jgi:hypothetical protein
LSWENISSNYKYRVQLSTDSLFTAPLVNTLAPSSSYAVGPLLSATPYYWRVLTWYSSNGTSPWSATRKFTVGLESPQVATPVLVDPAAFATEVYPNPRFLWNHASGATSYQLQVATVPNFSALVRNDSGITALSRTVNSVLTPNNEYYWRVRGWNSLGAGPWSEISAFTTVLSIPIAPTLLSPVAFATGVPADSPTLSWSEVQGAISYRLQVSPSSDFTTFVSNDTTMATSRTSGNLAGFTDYYWRVYAKNFKGTSAYSSVRRFTTGEPAALLPHSSGLLSVSALRVGGETVLRLSLPRAERVTVRWRDLRGRLSAPLFDEMFPAGSHSLRMPGAPAGVGVLEIGIGPSRRALLTSP